MQFCMVFCRRFAVLEDSFDHSAFSNNSRLFTIHASKSARLFSLLHYEH